MQWKMRIIKPWITCTHVSECLRITQGCCPKSRILLSFFSTFCHDCSKPVWSGLRSTLEHKHTRVCPCKRPGIFIHVIKQHCSKRENGASESTRGPRCQSIFMWHLFSVPLLGTKGWSGAAAAAAANRSRAGLEQSGGSRWGCLSISNC